MLAEEQSEDVISLTLSIHTSYTYQEILISRYLDTGKTLYQVVKKQQYFGIVNTSLDFINPNEGELSNKLSLLYGFRKCS